VPCGWGDPPGFGASVGAVCWVPVVVVVLGALEGAAGVVCGGTSVLLTTTAPAVAPGTDEGSQGTPSGSWAVRSWPVSSLIVMTWDAAPAGRVDGPTAAVSSPATASAISSFLFNIPGASLLPHVRLPPFAEGPAVARSTLLSGSDDCNDEPSLAIWGSARGRFGRYWGWRSPDKLL
jgi:hypothetical protein